MSHYEYKVVPAPRRGEKAPGVKTTEDRFAHALTGLMNRMGREGWEFQRSDTLPCEERQGLTGRTTNFQSMLIFRRSTAHAAPDDEARRVVLTEQADRVIPPAPRPEGPSERAETATSLTALVKTPTVAAPGPELSASDEPSRHSTPIEEAMSRGQKIQPTPQQGKAPAVFGATRGNGASRPDDGTPQSGD